uniref:Uncharacterized protein n=1 Tax=Arion vulgaris TaxID=1028688 RepID=A0A0B6ZP49_9EUPU
MRKNREESYSTFFLVFGVLFFILEIYFVALVECVSNDAGFAVSRFPGLNLFALQCNGSHLPNDVRSVQYISLERYSPQLDVLPHTIASLSSVDGIRLENSHGNAKVYVSGRFDGDNIQSTSLTVLLADVLLDVKVKYGCKISYIKRDGGLGVTERLLNVSFSDLQSVYMVQSADTKKSHHQQRLAQSTFTETKETWTIPMILLTTMAVLLFALFVVCVLLIADRYRDHCGNRRRMNRMKKSTCDSSDKEAETEPRPLPSPPSWTYPQVIGEPPPRSPYNRLRFGGMTPDTIQNPACTTASPSMT